MSKTELDFSTQGSFWATKDGQWLNQFAQDVYSTIPSSETPISLYRTGRSLLFSSPDSFYSVILNWVRAGLFVIAHYKPPAITRRELVVVQFTKVLFATEGGLIYQTVFDNLHNHLANSGLEQHLGNQLDPSFAHRKGRVTLEFEDPWQYDVTSLIDQRTSPLKIN